MEKHRCSLHIVMLPWFAFSHVKPFFELSKSITQLGHHVTFVATQQNIQILKSTQPHQSSFVRFITLPDPDPNSTQNQESFKKFLQSSSQPVNWVLYDFFPFWVSQVIAKVQIQCVLISLTSAVSNGFIWPAVNEINKPKLEDLTMPPKNIPFVTSVAYKPFEAHEILDGFFKNVQSGSQSMRLAVNGCDVVAIRSCFELEPGWLELLLQIYNKPVLPLGLLPPNISTRAENQNLFKWLDNKETRSVVYVAFGTDILLSQEQIHELAHVLEKSDLSFVWVLRIPKTEPSIELPDGFENRTHHRGMVLKGWAPQLEILAHPSVGGFVTHCGWNSITEALGYGVPLMLFPIANDQALNARSFAEQKIGVEIPRNEMDGSFACDDVAKILRRVIVDEEGKNVRDRAKELKSIFGKREFHEKFVMYLEDKCNN